MQHSHCGHSRALQHFRLKIVTDAGRSYRLYGLLNDTDIQVAPG